MPFSNTLVVCNVIYPVNSAVKTGFLALKVTATPNPTCET